jgi:hypothetical protein
LFGILDSDSEVFFNDKISRLEEQTDLIKPAREQVVVVKSTREKLNKIILGTLPQKQ